MLNNKGRERLLSVSEREVLRKIFGPAKDAEVWQMQYKRELYEMFKEAEVIRTVWVEKTVIRMIVK